MSNLDSNQPNTYFKKILFFWKHFRFFMSSEFSRESMSFEDRKKHSIFLMFGGHKDYFELASILQDTQLKLKNNENTPVAVSELIQPFLDYEKPINFDIIVIFKSLFKPLAISIVLILLTIELVATFTQNFVGIGFSIPFLIPTAFLIMTCFKYLNLVAIVSKEIIKYDSLQDSGLITKSNLKRPLFQWLSINMEGFNRGKVDNYLTEVYLAEKRIDDTLLEYIAFKYTSVISSSKDRNGKSRYETDSYRGILLPCSGLGRLAISPDKKVKSKLSKWTTVSQDFNKRFNIWCDQEVYASKLLSPATISDIEEYDKVLHSLNILTSPNGDICLLFKSSFEDTEFEETLSLNEPQEFLTSLKKDNSSPTLSHGINLMIKLMAQINVDKANALTDFVNDLPEVHETQSKPSHIKAVGGNSIERALSVIFQKMNEIENAKESKK